MSGAAPPVLRRVVTQAVIDAYAAASGDHNPIHVDPAFARSGPYGRTIAHGLMTLAFAGQMLNRWSDGRFDAEGEIEVAFVGPVFAGDEVEVFGELQGPADAPGLTLSVGCRVGTRVVLAGTARMPRA